MSPIVWVKISPRHHSILRETPVPQMLADAGIKSFTVGDAVRLAIITYLSQPDPLPAETLGARSAGSPLEVNLPAYLGIAWEHRAAAETRSKASILRAAIDLCWPPPLPPSGEGAAVPSAPTTRPRLNAALVRAQFGDRTETYCKSGRYR
jgi:hypothetical protein